ncbi:hypothetical protein FAK_41360 [Desulfoferula mesophila]|uniref:SPOR domain-containing protein n=1 Tax=Desulfoferula mesophila TaxID=3058419 RepID=A0AAU9EK19_9BACT|nr:hypothetical protein FAK_41360 [Desulfoferula mesophilus]
MVPPPVASATNYYVCLDTPRDSAPAAREQILAFADKMPPELALVPTASELVSSSQGKFFACLPPQPTRGQAQERLKVLDRRGVGVLGIKEGKAPQASAAAKPTPPNPADWFIQVNRFDETANALKDAKALANKGGPVTIMVTVPQPQFRDRVAAWLQGHRLAGEIFLCPARAKGCGVSYSVLAGPYYAQVEKLRRGLLGDWPGAFWLQRKDLPYRY